MLTIRADQMRTFEQIDKQRFEDEMVAHSKEFSPRLCDVMGDDQLLAVVRSAIVRAEEYGFTNRGPIRLFIEMMFLCGSGFDTDPQYPAIGAILRSHEDQMERAWQIHAGHNDYLERVAGPRAVNVHRALRELLTFAIGPVMISPDDLPRGLLREMERIFPGKATYVGEDGLMALIDEGISEARHYGFEGVRPSVLLVVLRFAFGHGCTNDPLYPWISRTMTDDKITGPKARAAQLEKKAITWLEHVVARNEAGSPP